MKLEQQLKEYVTGKIYPFHMPGHKRNVFLTEQSPYSYDITEIDGFDNLHDAQEIIKEGMDEAAQIYRTKQSFYLVNGSTGGILSAIKAVVRKNDQILIARNCHKSVYHAIEINELMPYYIYPSFIKEVGVAGSIMCSDVEAALEAHPQIKAVVITSPTYDGVTSDIKKIAEIVHRYEAVLIVDEAHGAHFQFGKKFPLSAVSQGADVVIQSLHKTLPSLTQTAILHRVSERVSLERLKHALSIYQTSSPSYVFLCSIEKSIQFAVHARKEFAEFEQCLDDFYKKTKELRYLYVWDPIKSDRIFDKDQSKIIIGAKGQMAGHQIYELLLKEYKIQPEMEALCYTVCLSSVCDTKEGFDRLCEALFAMDDFFASKDGEKELEKIEYPVNQMELLPGKVEDLRGIEVDLKESVGFISLEYIYLYPPGIPIVVPGEKISKEVVELLFRETAAGLTLKGLKNGSQKKVQVVVPGEVCNG